MRHALHRRSLELILCLTTACAVLPRDAAAQQRDAVQSGARIRLMTTARPTRWQVGTLLARTPDSISIRLESPPSDASLALHAIVRLERSAGVRSNTRRAARVGAMLGVAAGLVLTPAAVNACDDTCYIRVPAAVTLLSVVLGGAGAGLGALVGTAWRSEHWERLPVPSSDASQ